MAEQIAARPVPQVDDARPLIGAQSQSLAASERRLLLRAVDVVLLLIVARLLAWIHWGPSGFLALALPVTAAWLLVGQFSDLYDLATAARLRKSLVAVVRTALVVAPFLLIVFFARPHFVSREDVVALAIAPPIVISVWRLVYLRYLGAAQFQRRVVILGAGAACRALLEAVNNNYGHGVTVVGLLDDDPDKYGREIEGVPVLGDSSIMWSLVSSLNVEEIVLAVNRPGPVSDVLVEAVELCYERGIAISLMPHLYEEVAGQVPVDHMGRGWVGAVALGRPGGTLYGAFKRLIDVVVSGIALICAAPVMAIVALIVRRSSPGPILFRQARFGLHGKPFDVIKFRTMTMDAGRVPGDLSDRSRVTRTGKWLRKMHLDELPQLLLIVRGDMSLVGPRPKRADEARELEQTIPLYRVRYRVRPGLTGWAQIRYRYARSANDEMAKLRYDLYYVKHRSLVLDLSIMVRTAAHVLGMRGF